MFNEIKFIDENFNVIKENAKSKGKKTAITSLPLTPEAKKTIDEYAHGLGVSSSELVRNLLYAGWLRLQMEVNNG